MLIESTPNVGESSESLPPKRGLRVLVVDDNADAADLLGDALEAIGYEVRVAYDGASALALSPSFRPALALLDIGMPGMNGFELATRLHALVGLEGLKCVAVTGYGQADDRRLSAAHGFEAHILKPIDMPSLGHELRRLMA